MVDGCCNTSWCCYIFDQEPSQVSMINCTFTSRMTKTRFCGCGSWLNLWGLISSKRFNGGKRMFIISRPMNESDTTLWYCNESFQRMFLIVCRIVVPWRFCETQSSCLLRNLTAIIAYNCPGTSEHVSENAQELPWSLESEREYVDSVWVTPSIMCLRFHVASLLQR